MKLLFTLIVLLFAGLAAFSQNTRIDSLFQKFRQPAYYEDVYLSEIELEDQQIKTIPTLIKLLGDTSFVKLTETADLIYPGATEFYGHGTFLPYDIDWISVRAGWLLESLTFQDFGYRTTGVNDDYLFKLMKENYSEYVTKGTYDLQWKNKSSKEKLAEYRKILALKASQWWQKNKSSWTRLDAIKEALKSNNENRIDDVLQFLRYGETRCDGLNQTVYESEIKPLVIQLRDSKFKGVKDQVNLLLSEGLTYWTKKMTQKDKKGK
jgi:hypothetical protein